MGALVVKNVIALVLDKCGNVLNLFRVRREFSAQLFGDFSVQFATSVAIMLTHACIGIQLAPSDILKERILTLHHTLPAMLFNTVLTCHRHAFVAMIQTIILRVQYLRVCRLNRRYV